MRKSVLFYFLLLVASRGFTQIIRKPIPDKLVVLTFDDAVLSHITNVAPLLKKYHFGATFYVCEFVSPPFSDKSKYMSWQQIGNLGSMGFEIGNHTQSHTHVNKMDAEHFASQLAYIEDKAKEAKIKKPLNTFAYPGYDTHPSSLQVLKDKGYIFARGGGNIPYQPKIDHPYLVPSYTTYANNKTQIIEALEQAKEGNVVVLTIHGVPDEAHPQVSIPLVLFEEYLKYLTDNKYKVIALRDLAKYVNVKTALEQIKPDYDRVKNK